MRIGFLVFAGVAMWALSIAGCGGGDESSDLPAPTDSGAETKVDSSGGDSGTPESGPLDTRPEAPPDTKDDVVDAPPDVADAPADVVDAVPDVVDAPSDVVDTSPDVPDATDATDASDASEASDVSDASDGSDAAETADADTGPSCTGDLSGIGTADFRIAFTITTTATAGTGSAVINQRAVCGASHFWDVRMTGAGHLVIETDSGTLGADYTTFISTGAAVNDGSPHDIVLKRTSGTLTCTIDGVASGSASSASSFAALAAVKTGTDVCTGVDGTVALVGSVTKVCVSK